MIEGHKIIAFTPCGRKRYMDLLTAHMKRQHDLGHLDEWLLFNNAYSIEDSTIALQYAEHLPWIKVLHNLDNLRDGTGDGWNWHEPAHISRFFRQMTESENVIYIRLDDDIVYIDDNCFPRMVRYRIANPEPFLIFPTIVNNVRTSFHMQEQGKAGGPEWGGRVQNDMNDFVAHKTREWPFHLHMKALTTIERGTLVEELGLRSENFEINDWESGRISINAFAIWGKDLVECQVEPDEESYLCWWRPRALGRPNARAGDALLVHFAYHTQTDFMDRTGMLTDYAKIAPPLGFRTVRLPPPPPKDARPGERPAVPPLHRRNQALLQLQRRQNLGRRRVPTPGMKA